MNDLNDPCANRSRLSAYHDGELDSATAREMDRHLAQCVSCEETLRHMQGLSALFTSAAALQSAEAGNEAFEETLACVHAGVDAMIERRHSAVAGVLGIAGWLSAVAASLLIIGTAWLVETPTASAGRNGSPGTSLAVQGFTGHSTPAWERLALTLQPDPIVRPDMSAPSDDTQLADASLADWILDDLNNGVR